MVGSMVPLAGTAGAAAGSPRDDPDEAIVPRAGEPRRYPWPRQDDPISVQTTNGETFELRESLADLKQPETGEHGEDYELGRRAGEALTLKNRPSRKLAELLRNWPANPPAQGKTGRASRGKSSSYPNAKVDEAMRSRRKAGTGAPAMRRVFQRGGHRRHRRRRRIPLSKLLAYRTCKRRRRRIDTGCKRNAEAQKGG